MKLFKSVVPAIVFLVLSSNVMAADSVTKAHGGTVNTKLGTDYFTNEESSLTREWVTVHDGSMPADISGTVGVETINFGRDNSYRAEYGVIAKEALSAIEVIFLTFDIWGDYSGAFSATDIVDIEAKTIKKFNDVSWGISWKQMTEHYASIAYISKVRTRDGKVIKANPEIVLEQARKFSKKFSEGDLGPEPREK